MTVSPLSTGRATLSSTKPPARNQPRPGVWSISIRAGEHVSLRVREPVADQETVTCVIPGHNRTGTEYVADFLHVSDGPLDFAFDGRCAYQSTFEYRGPE